MAPRHVLGVGFLAAQRNGDDVLGLQVQDVGAVRGQERDGRVGSPVAARDADDVLAGVHQACVAGLGDYLGVHLDLHRYEALGYDTHGAVAHALSLSDAVGEYVGAEVHGAAEGFYAIPVLGFELLYACGWESRLVAYDDELDPAAFENLCCLYSGVPAGACYKHGLDI